jgi:hypothetical protein
MANVSINLAQFFLQPGGLDFTCPQASQEMESIRARLLALGAKVVDQSYGRFEIRCTQKQLKGVFSLREGIEVWFSTPLAKVKCERVLNLLKGTEVKKRLSYGSYYWNPCSISGYVTTYEEYNLVMDTIKDVRKNYVVVQRTVKI